MATKKAAEEVYVCKYADDKEDEDCVNCNGITMEVDGKEIPCVECAGYEKGEAVSEPKKVQNKKKTEKANTNTLKEEKPVKSAKTSTSTETKADIDGVKVTCLRYMSGVTIIHKDNYYKFNAEEEWQVNPAELTEDIETVREKLWAKLNSGVDKQVEEILTL